MKFVVTGCGRSGTGYTSKLLNAAGIPCGHEDVLGWGGHYSLKFKENDKFVADSTFIAAPFTKELSRELVVVHQVRPPLDVISATLGMAEKQPAWAGWLGDQEIAPWIRFIDKYTNVLEEAPGPRRVAAYWLRWNSLIEQYSHRQWAITDIGWDDVIDLCELVNITVDIDSILEAFDSVPTDTGHGFREPVTLDDIGDLEDAVVKAAERYGVPLSSL